MQRGRNNCIPLLGTSKQSVMDEWEEEGAETSGIGGRAPSLPGCLPLTGKEVGIFHPTASQSLLHNCTSSYLSSIWILFESTSPTKKSEITSKFHLSSSNLLPSVYPKNFMKSKGTIRKA